MQQKCPDQYIFLIRYVSYPCAAYFKLFHLRIMHENLVFLTESVAPRYRVAMVTKSDEHKGHKCAGWRVDLGDAHQYLTAIYRKR